MLRLAWALALCGCGTVERDDGGDGDADLDADADSDADADTDGDSGTGPVSAATWEDYCNGQANRNARCGLTDAEVDNQLSECLGWDECLRASFREDAVASVAECLASLAECNDDGCWYAMMTSVPVTTAGEAYQSACEAAASKCEPDGTGQMTEMCAGGEPPWQELTAGTLDRMRECFAQSCPDILPCLESSLADPTC